MIQGLEDYGTSPPSNAINPKPTFSPEGRAGTLYDSGYGSVAASMQGSSLEARTSSGSYLGHEDIRTAGTALSVPNYRGKLDPSDFYVRNKPHKFFVDGKVFIKLHTEDAGNAADSSSFGFSTVAYEELAYSQLRRFVVVKSRPKEFYSLCIPILTYRGQGAAKRGVDQDAHAIIYTGKRPPEKQANEQGMKKSPLQVIPIRADEKLDSMSRVNLGKTYTIEWNTKVKEIGNVEHSSLVKMINYWRKLMDTPAASLVIANQRKMKRKLDENYMLTLSTPSQREQTRPNFKSFGLDPRLLQAIAKEGFTSPMHVQSRVIPLALQGKDILGKRHSSSPLTLSLTLTNQLEQRPAPARPPPFCYRSYKSFFAGNLPATLILVPTHELAQQTSKVVAAFTAFCYKEIHAVDLTQKVPDSVQRSLLADSPNLVIATPARAALSISNSSFSVDNVSLLVIDEADLVLSYGYEEDLQIIAKSIPTGVQTMLMSATLTTEVDTLKNLYCRDPVTLELEDHKGNEGGVTQYVVRCAEDEKFLLAFVIFKLKLIKGKCIIFVADIDRCYRLKLFLEQFGVKACVLNSELPVNSRFHVVEEFNKGVYDIIIASDESEVLGDEKQSRNAADSPSLKPKSHRLDEGLSKSAMESSAEGNDNATDVNKQPSTRDQSWKSRKKHKKNKDGKEYGVSRGIDFKNVACVLNFDLPLTPRSYTHRIGRTARAGRTGMALSFVVPSSQYLKHRHTSTLSAQYDEVALAKIVRQQGKKGKDVKPYEFDMKQVDAFRYRVNDALRAVTQIAIREARTRELREEVLKSEKLKRHFEENPADLQHLRHDGELRPARVQPHLKHIPDYLMPSTGRRGVASADIGFVGFRKTSENRIRKARMQYRISRKGKKPISRKPDPLQTFNTKGRR
ncbi:MAG: hypothetical protein Q9225_002765 [Loekoesia sp. 1 TL-2023]